MNSYWLITSFFLYAISTAIVCHANNQSNEAPTLSTGYEQPGAEPYPASLIKKIKKMEKKRKPTYQPRTRHLNSRGEAIYTNRLFLESSPYLLQHAHNPVNWYPWGEEAFAQAKRLNRPIFLSVGYSTCHWCHVMEEESFEDLEIAEYINKHFIAIKVDREERPDIDGIYMDALHAMGKSGGWPMNMWLTPDKHPFFGGTYFPARDGDRGAGYGLLSILKHVHNTYQTQTEQVMEVGKSYSDSLNDALSAPSDNNIVSDNIMLLAAQYYKENADTFYGGIGNAPKFPSSTPFQFLLRYYKNTADEAILNIVKTTLNNMAAGGIYDQIGGGFHRYSIDTEWLVPHFEKMLYDNALLSIDYLEAYQLTGNEQYKNIATQILQYIKRDMSSPEGGFYSATDADSLTPEGEREEGYYFTWKPEEVEQAIGKEKSQIINAYYDISEDGNFKGRNIANTPESIAEFSSAKKIKQPDLIKLIKQSKESLYKYRNQHRPLPLRDEKIITAWNGLMISAYAKAGFILNNSSYTDQAIKSANFIFNKLFINGRLLRSYKDNTARHNAYLSDYAFLIAGLLDLYQVTFDIQWLNKAIKLDGILHRHYERKSSGGYYMTSDDHEKLLSRKIPNYDSAEPSGNSIQLMNLFRLAQITGKANYTNRAEKTLKYFSPQLEQSPMSLSKMLLAVDFYYSFAKEIIIVTPENNKQDSERFLNIIRHRYNPNNVTAVLSEGNNMKLQTKTITIAEGKKTIKGKTTAYVCKQGACLLPTSDLAIFKKQIESKQ